MLFIEPFSLWEIDHTFLSLKSDKIIDFVFFFIAGGVWRQISQASVRACLSSVDLKTVAICLQKQ